MEKEMYPRKYIKRLFRKPWKAKCKKCGEKMFLLPKDEYPDQILFRCVGRRCGNVVDLSEFKSKYVMDLSRMNKMVRPSDGKYTASLLLTRVSVRIKDKYYPIDNTTTYNPILRIKVIGNARSNENNDDHKKLLEIIINSIINAQK